MSDTAWGHKTAELTHEERTFLTKVLKCRIAVESMGDPENPKATWEIVRGHDGSYVGPTSLPDARGYLRWLIWHGIVPEAPSWSEGNTAAVGEAHDDEGGWVGWSHRGAARFKTRKEAEDFAREVS